jgi:hypothetical protein
MNNKMMLWAALLLGGYFLLRKKQTPAGLIGVNTAQPGYGGFDEADPW